MARTSLVHYIAPSAISITPNCNDSVSDLAVYITRGAKISAYSEAAGITMTGSGYQQWTLKGRNRRLNDSTKPYTIYIRLSKTDHDDAYLVFAARQQVQGVWKDKYPYVTKEGLYRDVYGQESSVYWYIRIGDVSLPGAEGREVTLDTGILGTQQYNEEWNLNPDSLPLRVELGCTIDGEDAGPTPYVYWGQDIVLEATLVEGWESIDNTRLDHWEIARQAEGQWPDQQRADAFASTGIISLQHSRDGEDDDFLGQVATVFQVNAWGYDDGDSSGSQQLVILGTASITIFSEVIESFDIVMSSEVMNYSPQSGDYSPADGIDITLRATDQKGDILDVTYAQFSSLGLHLSYAAVGSDVWTPVTVSGQPADIATGNIPASAFASGSSINVRLTRTEVGDSSGSSVEKELARKTIAFVADGEDSAVREWIYRQDNTTGYDSKTGTAHGEPVSGKTGDDWNADLTDDFVPTGWSDNALPVSAQHPDVYTSWRDYDEETEKWGDFHTPVVWSHWGEKGTDGDGCQYVYKLFDHELTSQEREDNIPDKPDNPDEHGEWIPTGWSDDPQAPTREMPFCYCSVIRQLGGVWGLFQKLGLWSKWSEDGMNAALCFVERGAVFVPTDTSGVVLEDFQIRVPFRVYAGNERLEVSDASIDEGDSAHYAHLFGGIIGMVGTVSGSKLSITGSTVQDTKLMLSGNHVVGNTEIVIEVKKGTTLDEHMVNLTVYSRNAIGTEYTSYASLEILSNGVPKNGDTPISVYKWNTSPDTPPAISGNDYPPTGWSKSAPDRPEGGDQYLWMSESVKRGDGTIMDWGRPVRISGNDGTAGEDAKEREWIYKVSDTNPGTPANPSDRTIDDYVPAGWSDNPSGVTATARTEWASWRDFDHETELWGDFHAPVVWSHYGENGMDGDGVEYVFIRTDTLVAPTIVDSPDSRTDSHGHTYLDDEYLPLATGGSLGTSQVECTDNPAGTSRLNPYEWVAKRTKGPADTVTGKRTWEKFSGEMSLWANYSENAIRLDLDDEMDMINTDSTGKVDVARTITVHATLYDGARAGTSATLVSTAASLAIGGVTPSLSIYNGVVTASWAFTRSNTLSTAATVSIIVQYNGVNYTASFTVAPSLGEAVYQIVPSMSTVPFERDTEGNLTPASRTVGLTIVKVDGQSTTSYTTAAQAGVTVRYSTTAMPSSASAGTGWSSGDITVVNSVEMLYIAMFNSSGTLIDRETVPVVKDGKDGASTPLCILERSAVFVPTDSTGKVVEAFQKIVTFKVQLGNNILAVKSASVSEEGSAHYVQLHGGKLAGGPMSVSGTKVSLVGTVSGTKVKVGSSYTAGPSGLIITVPKNTILDEHLAGVTVDVVDDKGREYTAYASLEIQSTVQGKDGKDGQPGQNGQNGKDGWMVTADPANVIINQNLDTQSTFTSCTVRFTAKKGNVTATIASIGTPSSSTFNVTKSGNTVIVSSPKTSGSSYYSEGYFIVDVNVTDPDTGTTVVFSITVGCYANLLGTWKQSVENGTETIIARDVNYQFVNNVLTVNNRDYTSIRNAALSAETWQNNSKAQYDGYSQQIINTNNRIDTADSHIQTIEKIQGENISLADPDAWEQGGTGNKDVGDDYSAIKVDSSTQIRTCALIPVTKESLIILKTNSVYQFLVENFDANRHWLSTSIWSSMYSTNESIKQSIHPSAKFIAIVIRNVNTSTPVSVAADLHSITMDVVNNPTVIQSEVKQTATTISATVQTNIENKLSVTGIKINGETREIHLIAGKVKFMSSDDETANPYFTIDSEGKITAKGGGSIGGFNIGTTSIGTDTSYVNAGYTYIERDGYMSLYNDKSGRTYALSVNGGAEILGRNGSDGVNKPVTIDNVNGNVTIHGKDVRIAANGRNGDTVHIGNGNSTLYIDAVTTTFSDTVIIDGVFAPRSSVKTSSFTLPQNPQNGQFFFCKSDSSSSGDLTISVHPSSGHTIMNSDGRDTWTSYNMNDDSMIVVYVGSGHWVLFRCT